MESGHKSGNITFDKIRAWLNETNDTPLSKKEKEIYERWDFAYDNLKIECKSVVAKRLVTKYEISIEQAYRDIRNCIKLLNPTNRHEAEWLRRFIIEDALLQIKVAQNSLDMNAWQKARTDLIKIYALENKDKEGIDPEMLGNNQYYITINFGKSIEKIDLKNIESLPENKRVEYSSFLFPDVNIEDAKIIMDS